MKNSFQDGVDSIYNALVGQGTTPSGKNPADFVNGIGVLATNKYNAGYSASAANLVAWEVTIMPDHASTNPYTVMQVAN